MTLIELVMVVSLLLLLAAIAIPSVQMAVEGRRVREAARAVNVYLGSARNRAMATGSPVGVAFQRSTNEANLCMTLDQVEAPPPYAGDTVSARARVAFASGAFRAQLSEFNPNMVRPGDRIQFNHQGSWYRINSVAGGTVTMDYDPNRQYPWPNVPQLSAPMPYEIRRQPSLPGTTGLHASIAKPLQLPLDAVVDLGFSGTQSSPTLFAGGTGPIVIMFSPNGGLDRVYHGTSEIPPTDRVFLLIGKRERIPPADAEDGLANWQDLENLWISISPQTGLVNTAEMAPGAGVAAARAFAAQSDSMGGR